MSWAQAIQQLEKKWLCCTEHGNLLVTIAVQGSIETTFQNAKVCLKVDLQL
jgi:hypothetical protein